MLYTTPQAPCCICHLRLLQGSSATTQWQTKPQCHWVRRSGSQESMAQSRGTYTSLVPSLLPTAAGHSGILLDPNQTLPGSANPLCWRGGEHAPAQTPPKAGTGSRRRDVSGTSGIRRAGKSLHASRRDRCRFAECRCRQREFQSKVCTSSNVLGMLPRKHSRTESSHTATRKWPSTHSTCTPGGWFQHVSTLRKNSFVQ